MTTLERPLICRSHAYVGLMRRREKELPNHSSMPIKVLIRQCGYPFFSRSIVLCIVSKDSRKENRPEFFSGSSEPLLNLSLSCRNFWCGRLRWVTCRVYTPFTLFPNLGFFLCFSIEQRLCWICPGQFRTSVKDSCDVLSKYGDKFSWRTHSSGLSNILAD